MNENGYACNVLFNSKVHQPPAWQHHYHEWYLEWYSECRAHHKWYFWGGAYHKVIFLGRGLSESDNPGVGQITAIIPGRGLVHRRNEQHIMFTDTPKCQIFAYEHFQLQIHLSPLIFIVETCVRYQNVANFILYQKAAAKNIKKINSFWVRVEFMRPSIVRYVHIGAN